MHQSREIGEAGYNLSGPEALSEGNWIWYWPNLPLQSIVKASMGWKLKSESLCLASEADGAEGTFGTFHGFLTNTRKDVWTNAAKSWQMWLWDQKKSVASSRFITGKSSKKSIITNVKANELAGKMCAREAAFLPCSSQITLSTSQPSSSASLSLCHSTSDKHS